MSLVALNPIEAVRRKVVLAYDVATADDRESDVQHGYTIKAVPASGLLVLVRVLSKIGAPKFTPVIKWVTILPPHPQIWVAKQDIGQVGDHLYWISTFAGGDTFGGVAHTEYEENVSIGLPDDWSFHLIYSGSGSANTYVEASLTV